MCLFLAVNYSAFWREHKIYQALLTLARNPADLPFAGKRVMPDKLAAFIICWRKATDMNQWEFNDLMRGYYREIRGKKFCSHSPQAMLFYRLSVVFNLGLIVGIVMKGLA